MLVLSLKAGDSIYISDNIDVKVCELFSYRKDGPRECRLAVQAPRDVPVHRLEVALRIKREAKGESP